MMQVCIYLHEGLTSHTACAGFNPNYYQKQDFIENEKTWVDLLGTPLYPRNWPLHKMGDRSFLEMQIKHHEAHLASFIHF